MPIETKFVFTLNVTLTTPIEFGITPAGERRLIPISGGTFKGQGIEGRILPGGGDWNSVRSDGVVHLYAKYSLQTSDGVNILITNEGWGRADPERMKGVFGDNPGDHSVKEGAEKWYHKTCPRFEAPEGSKYEWLNKSMFIGDLHPPIAPNGVIIDVYEVL